MPGKNINKNRNSSVSEDMLDFENLSKMRTSSLVSEDSIDDSIDDKESETLSDSDADIAGESDSDTDIAGDSDSEVIDEDDLDTNDLDTNDVDTNGVTFEADIFIDSDIDRLKSKSIPFLNSMKKEKVKFSRKTVVITDKTRFVTKPYISKFELARCLSERANMLEHGAQALVTSNDNDSYQKIALKEIREKRCPMYLYRPVPHFSHLVFEKHDINELSFVESLL